MHSAISRAMGRAGNLYVPSQLLSVFSLAKHNKVHPLEYEDFIDFKLFYQELRILNSRRDSEDGVFNWNSIMELRVDRQHPETIFYKTSHLAEEFSEIPLKRVKNKILKTFFSRN